MAALYSGAELVGRLPASAPANGGGRHLPSAGHADPHGRVAVMVAALQNSGRIVLVQYSDKDVILAPAQ